MGEITITIEEYKALLEARIVVGIIARRLLTDKYVGRSDIMEIIGMKEKEEKE